MAAGGWLVGVYACVLLKLLMPLGAVNFAGAAVCDAERVFIGRGEINAAFRRVAGDCCFFFFRWLEGGRCWGVLRESEGSRKEGKLIRAVIFF